MYPTFDLKRLADFFTAEELEWKPITVSKKTNKGLAAAYISNRAIMDRLDAVVGPENWRNEFKPGPGGGIVCGLSVRVVREDGGSGGGPSAEWVTKWDGADNTDIEAVKGGLSNAMRRAAVHWGIGRYLYDLPSQWVPVDDYGKFVQPPRVPSAFLPPSARTERPERLAYAERPAPSERPASAVRPEAAEHAPSAERPEKTPRVPRRSQVAMSLSCGDAAKPARHSPPSPTRTTYPRFSASGRVRASRPYCSASASEM